MGALVQTFNIATTSEIVPTMRSIDALGLVGKRPSLTVPVFDETVLHGTVSQTERGTTMTKTIPVLLAGSGFIRFVKVHGPDDMVVDPLTGVATWVIPAAEHGRGYNCSIRAWNGAGDDLISWVEIVKATATDVTVYEVGPTRTYATVQDAVSVMSGGEVVVIDPGTYTGVDNSLMQDTGMPGGTTDQFSTFIARHPPSSNLVATVLDGENSRSMMEIRGNHKNADWDAENGAGSGVKTTNRSYFKISGIVSRNDSSGAFYALYLEFGQLQYCYAVRDQHPSNGGTGSISFRWAYYSTNTLVEDCFNGGFGDRYLFGPARCSNTIYRRNLGRHGAYGLPEDSTKGTDPVCAFQFYLMREYKFNNNISIDTDLDVTQFWINFNDTASAFANANTGWNDWSENVSSDRNIACNTSNGAMDSASYLNTSISLHNDMLGVDCVMVGGNAGAAAPGYMNAMRGAGFHLRHTYVMVGAVAASERGVICYNRSQLTEYENCIFDAGYVRENGLEGAREDLGLWFDGGGLEASSPASIATNVTYSAIHNPGAFELIYEGGNEELVTETYINPYENGLSYPMWIDEGSVLKTSGRNSEQQGAEILTYKGKAGTFYGESDSNDETNIRCWPMAQEREKIAWGRSVATYTGPTQAGTGAGDHGPDATLSATRGSMALGMSPTSYLARKLGNATPQFSEVVTVSGVNVSIAWQPLEAAIDRDHTVKYLVYRGDSNGANGAVIATLTPTEFNYIDTPGSGTHSYWVIRRDTTRGFSLRPPGYYSLGVVA